MATASKPYPAVGDIKDSGVQSTPVYVKCCASNASDILSLATSEADGSTGQVSVHEPGAPVVTINPTRSFDADASHEDIFEHIVQPAIDDVICGYNSTLWVIGHPGSGERALLTSNSKAAPNGLLHLTAARLIALTIGRNSTSTSPIGNPSSQPGPRYSLYLSVFAEFHGAIYDILASDDKPMEYRRRVRERPGYAAEPYLQDQMWVPITSVAHAHRMIREMETRLLVMTTYMGHRDTDVQPTWQWRVVQTRGGIDVVDGDDDNDDDDDDWCVVGATTRVQERNTTLSMLVYYNDLHRRRQEQNSLHQGQRYSDMRKTCLSRVIHALVEKKEYQEEQRRTGSVESDTSGTLGVGEDLPVKAMTRAFPRFVHIPYRDEVLVRLHRASLGGSTRCRVLCIASARVEDVHAVSELLQLLADWASVRQRPVLQAWQDRGPGAEVPDTIPG